MPFFAKQRAAFLIESRPFRANLYSVFQRNQEADAARKADKTVEKPAPGFSGPRP